MKIDHNIVMLTKYTAGIKGNLLEVMITMNSDCNQDSLTGLRFSVSNYYILVIILLLVCHFGIFNQKRCAPKSDKEQPETAAFCCPLPPIQTCLPVYAVSVYLYDTQLGKPAA